MYRRFDLRRTERQFAIRAVGFLLVCLSLVKSGSAQEGETWMRGFLGGTGGSDRPFIPFQIGTVGSSQGRLLATFVYLNYAGDDHRPPSIRIKGVKMTNDDFWPDVVVQAAPEKDGKWRTLEEHRKSGERCTLTVEPRTGSVSLYVDLSCFRQAGDDAQYGRVIISGGQAAVFELDALKPPP